VPIKRPRISELDSIEFVSRSAIGVVLIALSVWACGVGALQTGAPTQDVVRVETIDLGTARAALDPTDAAVIDSFDAGVPVSIPERAVAMAAFMAGQYRDPPHESRDLVLASVRSTPLVLNVICIDAGGQLPCSDRARVWEVRFDDAQAAVVDTSGAEMRPAAGVLLSVDGDDRRAQIASRGFWIALPRAIATSPGDPFRHDPVLGGCGFAVLVDELAPMTSFTPLTAAPRSSVLYLVVQVCDGSTTTAIVPYLVVDRSDADLLGPQAQAGHALAVRGGNTYVIEIPLSDLGAAQTIQAFVLPTDEWEAWVSRPVSITR